MLLSITFYAFFCFLIKWRSSRKLKSSVGCDTNSAARPWGHCQQRPPTCPSWGGGQRVQSHLLVPSSRWGELRGPPEGAAGRVQARQPGDIPPAQEAEPVYVGGPLAPADPSAHVPVALPWRPCRPCCSGAAARTWCSAWSWREAGSCSGPQRGTRRGSPGWPGSAWAVWGPGTPTHEDQGPLPCCTAGLGTSSGCVQVGRPPRQLCGQLGAGGEGPGGEAGAALDVAVGAGQPEAPKLTVCGWPPSLAPWPSLRVPGCPW